MVELVINNVHFSPLKIAANICGGALSMTWESLFCADIYTDVHSDFGSSKFHMLSKAFPGQHCVCDKTLFKQN